MVFHFDPVAIVFALVAIGYLRRIAVALERSARP